MDGAVTCHVLGLMETWNVRAERSRLLGEVLDVAQDLRLWRFTLGKCPACPGRLT